MTRPFVPIVTEAQLDRIERLFARGEQLFEELQEAAMDLNSSLAVLRAENHPEGWTAIEVVPDASVKTLIIEHRSGSRTLTKGIG